MSTHQVISFHYTLRNKAGEILDQSHEGRPLEFVTGTGVIIEGLERSLLQMESGEKREVLVRPEHGYGFRDESQINVVSKSELPVEEVEVGDFFQAGSDRHAPVVQVVKVEGDQVTLDANHPLAGQDLVFDVEIASRREADESEVAHGHAHHGHDHSHGGEGCCGGNGGGCGCH